MVESLAHLQLRPIDLNQVFDPLVFRDLLQIVWNIIEKHDNDMCMSNHSNIVCTVTVAMSMMYPSNLRDVRMSSFCEGETQAYTQVYCTSAFQDGFP